MYQRQNEERAVLRRKFVTKLLYSFMTRQRDNDAATFDHAKRIFQDIFTDRIQHDINILDALSKCLPGIVDHHISAQLAHKFYVARRCCRNHMRALPSGELDRKVTNATCPTRNENRLPGSQVS